MSNEKETVPEVPTNVEAAPFPILDADLPAATAPVIPKSFQISDDFSDPEEEPEQETKPVDPTQAAMLRIAQSMETMMARGESTRQIPYNEMKPDTPWNPTGKQVRLQFARPTFLHGIALNPLMHTEGEIKLFNSLRPGRYLDRQVEVQRGNDGSVNLKWAGAKIDQRIDIYSRFPTITVLLEAVIKDREVKEAKKRAGLTYEEDDFR